MKVLKIHPKGVCTREIIVSIDDDKICNVDILGGCPGYSEALSRMLVGTTIQDTVSKLEGITCGTKDTSCPSQIAISLKSFLKG